MKRQIIDAIFIFLIVFVIAFCIWVGLYITSEKAECIKNPFIYSANRINGNVSCVCYEYTQWAILPLYFNKSNYWTETQTLKTGLDLLK